MKCGTLALRNAARQLHSSVQRSVLIAPAGECVESSSDLALMLLVHDSGKQDSERRYELGRTLIARGTVARMWLGGG